MSLTAQVGGEQQGSPLSLCWGHLALCWDTGSVPLPQASCGYVPTTWKQVLPLRSPGLAPSLYSGLCSLSPPLRRRLTAILNPPPTLALHCALLCFLTLFTACRYFIIFPWSRAPVSYKDISLLKAGILCINFARHEVHGNPRCLIHCRLRNCVE